MLCICDAGIRSMEQDAETLRLQILGNPEMMAQLRAVSVPLFCSLLGTSVEFITDAPKRLPFINSPRHALNSPKQLPPTHGGSSSFCKRNARRPVKLKWSVCKPRRSSQQRTSSISRRSDESKKRFDRKQSWKIWNMRWSTLPRALDASLCSMSTRRSMGHPSRRLWTRALKLRSVRCLVSAFCSQ